MGDSAGKPKHSIINLFSSTGGSLFLAIIIILIFVIQLINTGIAAKVAEDTKNALHNTAVAVAKNTFASDNTAEIGGSMYPYISPAAYGQGGYSSMMFGSTLGDSIYTGNSWNPPNQNGWDCNGGDYNFINTASMPNLPSSNEKSTTTSKNSSSTASTASAASDQAAFYAALNGTGSMETALNDISGLSNSQLTSDLSMLNNDMNQYGLNMGGMGSGTDMGMGMF